MHNYIRGSMLFYMLYTLSLHVRCISDRPQKVVRLVTSVHNDLRLILFYADSEDAFFFLRAVDMSSTARGHISPLHLPF